MTRIDTVFQALDRPALITFITAGDPDYNESLEILKSLPGAGADIIELGMPFSDPMADGPVIQEASERALQNDANMTQTLQMVRNFRLDNDFTPIVLMGYMNPVFKYGADRFCRDAAQAGVDGLIIVDLPPEEADELTPHAVQNDLDVIRLITPTTSKERLSKVVQGSSGFLYYVSITGVTGTASADQNAVQSHIQEIKDHTDLPIAIGFGIKTPEDAMAMGKIADGVVVGSAIVNNITEHADEIPEQVKSLAQALR